jgi:hypothetical protein
VFIFHVRSFKEVVALGRADRAEETGGRGAPEPAPPAV